ncbi:MAG: class I SAM-dependent methyltransferase [Caldilineaceae bacterium]
MTVGRHPSNSAVADVPVIDYEGSHYKSDFWLGQGRDYEDAAERLALIELLPTTGGRIAEIGAGFGRLADLYLGYEQIVLFDYSRTLLADAVVRWGNDPRFIFVAGNIYQLPFATGILDSLVMVRVMHHLANVPAALQQLTRVLHSQSVAVLEYANKRNIKAIVRWLFGKQPWSPFEPLPVEFVELNFDFHPAWMRTQVNQAALDIQNQWAVSHFRLPLLKDRIPAQRLAQWDRRIFSLGGQFPLAPSVFLKGQISQQRERAVIDTSAHAVASLFRCPHCAAEMFTLQTPSLLVCGNCQAAFAQKGKIWDFKELASV